MNADTQIGKYQLVAELARGGMGIVYLAIAQGPGGFSKLLVVKELKPELSGEPAFLEMFFEEARLAARLNHPNIGHIYEVDSDRGRHFIVMDYLDGRPFHHVLRRHDAGFTRGMTLRVLCEVLGGLEYAHTLVDYDGRPLAIVHRDATPQNVFLTFDGQIKLVDFGIATSDDSKIVTVAGTLKGKPAYMPPEQVLGLADCRSDLFAVGVMLFEAVADRRLWQGRSDGEIIAALVSGQIPSLAEVAPGAPPELARICDKALAPSVEDRYQTAAEMAADLEAYAASSGQRVTAREVGQHLATIFDKERQQTRAAIEARLAAVRGEHLDDPMVPLAPSRGSLRPGRGVSSGRPLRAAIEAVRPRAASEPTLLSDSAGGTASPVPPPPPPRLARQRPLLASVGLVALLILGFLALARAASLTDAASATWPDQRAATRAKKASSALQ